MDFHIIAFEVLIANENIIATFLTFDKKEIGTMEVTFDFFMERTNYKQEVNFETLQEFAEDNYCQIIWDDNTDTTPDPEHN